MSLIRGLGRRVLTGACLSVFLFTGASAQADGPDRDSQRGDRGAQRDGDGQNARRSGGSDGLPGYRFERGGRGGDSDRGMAAAQPDTGAAQPSVNMNQGRRFDGNRGDGRWNGRRDSGDVAQGLTPDTIAPAEVQNERRGDGRRNGRWNGGRNDNGVAQNFAPNNPPANAQRERVRDGRGDYRFDGRRGDRWDGRRDGGWNRGGRWDGRGDWNGRDNYRHSRHWHGGTSFSFYYGNPYWYSSPWRGARYYYPRYYGGAYGYFPNRLFIWYTFPPMLYDGLSLRARQYHEQAYYEAMDADIGDSIYWEDGNDSGTITTTRDGWAGEKYCREFQQDIIIDGEHQDGYGVACREPDGTWRLVEDPNS